MISKDGRKHNSGVMGRPWAKRRLLEVRNGGQRFRYLQGRVGVGMLRGAGVRFPDLEITPFEFVFNFRVRSFYYCFIFPLFISISLLLYSSRYQLFVFILPEMLVRRF